MKIIIMSTDQNNEDFFFSHGARWVREYPNAIEFPDEETAIAALDSTQLDRWVSVVADYGLDSENVLCDIEPDGYSRERDNAPDPFDLACERRYD